MRRRITSDTLRMIIQIDEVDIAKREIHAVDKTGRGHLRIPYTSIQGSAFSIPKQGEFWWVVKHEHDWYLEHRFDTGDENISLQDMEAGDARVHAASTLHLDAAKTTINGSPFGVTTWEQFTIVAGDLYDVADSRYRVILSNEPTHFQSVQIFISGTTLVNPSNPNIELRDKTLIFPSTPGNTYIIYYQYIP